MQERLLRERCGAILYDADLLRKGASDVCGEWFTPDHWGAGSVDIVPGGRARVAFIRNEQGQWVLRHYRRGGLIAQLADDRYLWTGEARTRSFREWRLLAQLRAWDLPVPAPVAARYERSALWYRADLLTVAIPHEATLAQLLLDARVSAACWSQVGATLARFHARGVQHADLNAHNILLDKSGAVFVLDFDRGRIRERGAWHRQVLARLHRSLLKIDAAQGRVTSDDWQRLVAAHDAG